MSTDPDQPARIKLPTRNDRDWSAMRAPLAHLMRLAETRSQSVHHHRHTMPLGVWRRHLGMGRVPIWAQWSIIGVGIMSSPLLLLLALVPSAGCCFAGSGYPVHSRARSAPGGHARVRSKVGRRFDKPARHLRDARDRLGARRRPARA